MSEQSQGMLFFVNGAVALIVLFLVTLAMDPSPQVNGLRALIIVGLAIVCVKMVLRHYNIDWPPKRH